MSHLKRPPRCAARGTAAACARELAQPDDGPRQSYGVHPAGDGVEIRNNSLDEIPMILVMTHGDHGRASICKAWRRGAALLAFCQGD